MVGKYNAGFYRNPGDITGHKEKTYPGFASLYKDKTDPTQQNRTLTELIEKGEVRFAENARIILISCEAGGKGTSVNAGDLAGEFAKHTKTSVIASAGRSDAGDLPKEMPGQRKLEVAHSLVGWHEFKDNAKLRSLDKHIIDPLDYLLPDPNNPSQPTSQPPLASTVNIENKESTLPPRGATVPQLGSPPQVVQRAPACILPPSWGGCFSKGAWLLGKGLYY